MSVPSFDELLKSDREITEEYDGSYYIKVKSNDFYDNSMYKVDIKTWKVSPFFFTEYLANIKGKARSVRL